jgi:hypothetical protein
VFPDSQTFRQVVNSGLEGEYLIMAHPTCTLAAWSLLRQVTSRLHNVRIAERLDAKRMWKGAWIDAPADPIRGEAGDSDSRRLRPQTPEVGAVCVMWRR